MKDEDVIKELLNKGIYLEALEIAESCSSGKIQKLQLVLERMVWTLMMKKDDDRCRMLKSDVKGNVLEAEGSEDLKEACWFQIKKILARNSNNPALAERVVIATLNCNPTHKLPSFLTQILDIVNLSHLYMKYGRIQDAALVLLEGINKKQYIDPIIYAKICKALTSDEDDWILKRLTDYH